MFKASELKHVGKFPYYICHIHNGNSVCGVSYLHIGPTSVYNY
jgi:hypothetical protein